MLDSSKESPPKSTAYSLAEQPSNHTTGNRRIRENLRWSTRISLAKDTELEFATTCGGNRLSTSVGGTLTGRGGNLIIIDDPLKPQDGLFGGSPRKQYSELADKYGDSDEDTVKRRVMRARRRQKALNETTGDILSIAALGQTDGATPYARAREESGHGQARMQGMRPTYR